MSGYTQVLLREICTVNPRAQKAGCPDETIVSFVPMAAIDEQAGAITVRVERPLKEVKKGYTSFEDGDVLFAKITPCMENGKVALAHNLTNGIGRGSTEFHVLRPGKKVLSEYIYHFLRQPRLREKAKKSFTGTAGQQRVPKSFIQNVLIPLPPLGEQSRIVNILNRAERIKRLRAQAQERLREFIPALFVKMFGDPATNPMGWPKMKLGEICLDIEQCNPGKQSTKEFQYVDISGVDNVSKKISKSQLILGAEAPSRARRKIRTSDVLVSSVRPNLNAVAIVPHHLDGGIASTGFCVLRANQAFLNPTYLFSQVCSTHFVNTLVSKARGASYPAVSDKDIREIPITLPSLHIQNCFADIVEAMQATSAYADLGNQTAASLSTSLMSCLLGVDT